MPNVVYWSESDAPSELHGALAALEAHYPIELGSESTVLFQEDVGSGGVNIDLRDGQFLIRYRGISQALRGLGLIFSDTERVSFPYEENSPFERLGMMLDCSRNAVMNVEHVRHWLRSIALLGYNQLMLYTEDTYEIEGEEYFGYKRGRYTQDELKEIDQAAEEVGIEVVGCIQTLGHLEQILKWSTYSDIRDQPNVIMVDEQRSYELIDKMVSTMAKSLKSRRLHIGLDETWGLGRGRFIEKNGFQDNNDIFVRHLGRVEEICRTHGMEPMMWSDTFFRMAQPGGLWYNIEGDLPPSVVEKIPKEMQLVFWDYYHADEASYRKWLQRHKRMGFKPVMASGIWSWSMLWYGHDATTATVDPCIKVCREEGIEELFFTLWGDDGAVCEMDSALAGIAYAAERVYRDDKLDESLLAERYHAVCFGDYRAVIAASRLSPRKYSPDVDPGVPSIRQRALPFGPPILWDDPILGLYWHSMILRNHPWQKTIDDYRELISSLALFHDDPNGPPMSHAQALAAFMLAKLELRQRMEDAYDSRDDAGLRECLKGAEATLPLLDKLSATFRTQWMKRNKPQGLEVIQIRFGGQRARFIELAQRLAELMDGRIDSIPELDERPEQPAQRGSLYRHLATSSSIL